MHVQSITLFKYDTIWVCHSTIFDVKFNGRPIYIFKNDKGSTLLQNKCSNHLLICLRLIDSSGKRITGYVRRCLFSFITKLPVYQYFFQENEIGTVDN